MAKCRSALENERRSFLKTVGRAGISFGLLRASSLATGMMLGRSAIAQNATGVNKVVFVYLPGGTPFQDGKSLFTPSSSLVLEPTSAPLEAVKNEIVFFSDVLVTGGGGHGYTQKTLGATKNKDTIDVALSDTLGSNSPFPHLLLGTQSNVGNQGGASQRNYQNIAYQDNPIATFNRIFGGVTGGGSGGGSVDTLQAQSVLDVQKAEIAQLKTFLGVEEQVRLDTHLASIQRLEQRLASGSTAPPVSGSNPADSFNPSNFIYDPNDHSTFTRVADLQVDLAVLALQMNQSRVISVMFGNHDSNHSVPELDWADTYHNSIHGSAHLGRGPYTETRTHLTRRLAYLLEQLKATPDEFGNPLLDSTLVVHVTDMGDGDSHTTTGAPMFLAGGGAAVNRGQLSTCGEHVNMFDTAAELLGMTGVVPRYGDGPLTGIIT